MKAPNHFRYLPRLPDEAIWGMDIKDYGESHIRAGQPYPPAGHPDAYTFNWEKGRSLAEYQIILITRGRGVYENRTAGRRPVKAGDLLLVFPGEWHRYRPEPQTGWDELWVGFSGDYLTALMDHFFTPARPVMPLADSRWLRGKLRRLIALLQQTPAPAADQWGVKLLEVLAHVRGQTRLNHRSELSRWDRIRQEILQQAAGKLDWRKLARRHGLSYPTFRREFQRVTGHSPLEYQIQIRMNRAVDLLRRTSLPVKEIAGQLGYQNVYFFTRQFKHKTGQTPTACRAMKKEE